MAERDGGLGKHAAAIAARLPAQQQRTRPGKHDKVVRVRDTTTDRFHLHPFFVFGFKFIVIISVDLSRFLLSPGYPN